jgi:MAC/Perforin domain
MRGARFVRRGPMAGDFEGREFSLDWGEQSRVRELRIWQGSTEGGATTVIPGLQFIWETDVGATLRSPVIGPLSLGDDGRPVPTEDVTVLLHNDVVNGLYGHATDRIHSIGVITQDGPLQLLGKEIGDPYRWTLAEMPGSLMPRALVTGVFGRYDRSGLRGIGLRCAVDGVGPLLLSWGPGGRVVPVVEAGKPPRLDEERVPAAPAEHPSNADRFDHVGEPTPETMRPNPNHVRIDVRRIDQWDDALRIHAFDGAQKEFRFRKRGVDRDGRGWVDIYDGLDGSAVVHIGSNDAWIELTDGDTDLTRPALSPPAAPDGPTWDNVFSLDHRVDYLAWALRGLDISRLAPFNFQEASGVLRDEVFRGPAPGSRDFHIATTGKSTVVPNGWRFMGDVAGSNKARTASTFSDEESRQTWATSLGVSAEADALGAKIAYTNNSKAHGELTNASSGKDVSTVVEAMELSHSLVVDLAAVRLADGFRSAVDELKLDANEERIGEFVDRFGTHFAYAVTFGSKTWEQRHETEASVAAGLTTGTSQEQSLSAGYHNEIGGVQMSVSVGKSGEMGGSTKTGTGLDVSSSGSVGSASEPVPILLEVEDLTHLLSPVFFDDPYVYVDLKHAVDEFLDEFPLGFDYSDEPGGLRFEIFPPRLASKGRLLSEGLIVSRPVAGAPTTFWWLRGGKRHHIGKDLFDPKTAPLDAALIVATIGEAGIDPVKEETLQDYPDSGEEPATIEGVMIRLPSEPERVWLIGGGKRHVVPSEGLVEILGGWDSVAVVDRDMEELFLSATEEAKAPISAEGRMIRALVEGKVSDQVWVIHDRQRHLIANESGIHDRGGWWHVALVRPEVLAWFPDSGTPAR